MPYGELVFRPGVNAQLTPTLGEGGYSACNRIRWRDGVAEILGGWTRLIDEPVVGIPRGMHAWADLSGFPYLAIGTAERLMVYTPGALDDITPLRATVNQAPDFATVIATPVVTVGDVAHGASVSDWVNIVTEIAIGGLLLQGFYQVLTVPDANHYTISAGSNATATVASPGGATAVFDTTNTLTEVTVTLAAHGRAINDEYTIHVSTTVGGIVLNGTYLVQTVPNANQFTITGATAAGATATGSENAGLVRIEYLLASGLETAVYQTGYGSGGYGTGVYGISTSIAGLANIRQWSLDNWGEQLIASPTMGEIYAWQPSSAFPPATEITQAPDRNYDVLVANPQQMLISFGTEVSPGVFDPNLIRWCDVADYTDWVASATNQAGSYRIPTGSRLLGGLATTTACYAWTNIDVYSMQYQGLPYVWGFRKAGSGCGLIAKRAKAAIGDRCVWMGPKGFFQMPLSGGTPTPLYCPVWDIVFKNMNSVQADKVHAAVNSLGTEVAWYFCSDGSDECDLYVKMNFQGGQDLWDYGTLDRTAWVDVNVFGSPIGGDAAGLLQQHETSKNADGQLMGAWLRSSVIDLAKGEEFLFIDELVPDVKFEPGSTLALTITMMEDPNGKNPMTAGPYTFTETSGLFNPSVRGRQGTFLWESNDLDSFWRLGRTRYRFADDGRN